MLYTLSKPIEIQEAYQDSSVAAGYCERRFASELNRLLHDRQVAVVQRLMDQIRMGRVLEIAPGPGRLTRHLRTSGTLVCLEINEEMIAHGRPACEPSVVWVRGNGFQLPFAPGFDLVYSFRFVRHFHWEDRQRLYREIHRVLRPGGLFVMDAVNERVSQPMRAAHPEAYPIYDKLYRPAELRDELAEAGFDLIELEPVQKLYRWQYLSQVLVGPRINGLNRAIIRGLERLPMRNGLEWIVTCRRA